MATWSAAYINDLPDASFLYIEPGGTKDDDGRTVPRSLRHFPVKDADGSVDLPHLRNALARIPQSDLPQSVKDRCTAKAQRLLERANRSWLEIDFEERSAAMWPEADYEMRAMPDGFELTGYAAVFNMPSLPMSFPFVAGGRTFREVIHPGAFAKSLSELPDVTLRYQHDLTALPLGRTKAGTMELAEDERGLRVRASLPDNEWGRPVRDAIARGDISGMSFRFIKVIDKWEDDTRHLHEVRLGPEVSVTDMPAYPDTSVMVRRLAEEVEAEADDLAEAFRVLRDPEAKLTAEQHDLLQTVVNARTDEPFVGPKVAQYRELLAARARG